MALPISLAIWALSIAVPVAIESYQAAGKIFVTPAERERLVDQAPTAPPEMPDSVRNPDPTATELPEGAPTPTATTPAPTATLPDLTGGGNRSDQPRIGATPTPFPRWNGSDPFHILLLGVDERPSDNSPGRSDTIIVVRIDPQAPRVDMFSIPRDLLVAIPGYAEGTKVNGAYPAGESSDIPGGGPSLVAQTIELNFGVPIDHFATVDIPGLEQIIDILGGVIIDVPAQLKDDQYPTDDYRFTRAYFPTGPQLMTGEQAVRYARTRHADNDFRRSERQQQLLIALREQAIQSGLIGDLPELISEVGDAVRTDLSLRQTLSLARLAQELPRENIWVHQLTPYMEPQIINEGYYLVGDWEALRWVTQNLPEDPNATNRPGD